MSKSRGFSDLFGFLCSSVGLLLQSRVLCGRGRPPSVVRPRTSHVTPRLGILYSRPQRERGREREEREREREREGGEGERFGRFIIGLPLPCFFQTLCVASLSQCRWCRWNRVGLTRVLAPTVSAVWSLLAKQEVEDDLEVVMVIAAEAGSELFVEQNADVPRAASCGGG